MKETAIYGYYAFGYNYYILRYELDQKSNKDVILRLNEYLSQITVLELQVTSHVVSPLKKLIKKLEEEKPDDTISDAHYAKVKEITNAADPTLDAELQMKKVLSVTPKRFDVAKLLTEPKQLLANDCWDMLTSVAKNDFSEATRCIAMSLHTAAAFHLMRCVEECVKMIYYEFIKSNRMDKPMWGPMIEKLRNKNKPRPAHELLDQLDIIRKNFRNPTQHPEKFYTSDGAQDLLNSSIVAINAVCHEIHKRKTTK